MAHITAAQIKQHITDIVAEQDVGDVTSKQLREMIEDRCGLARNELQSRKQEVNNLTAEVLADANKLSTGPSSGIISQSGNGNSLNDTDQSSSQGSTSSAKKRARQSHSSDDAHPTTAGLQRTDQGEPYLDLGGNKRVTIGQFKGKLLINIREYYASSDDPAKMLPGKKGIAINPDQWNKLCRHLGELSEEIAKHQDG